MISDLIRKHCGKRRKCWLPALSPFPTMFSTLSQYSHNVSYSIIIFPQCFLLYHNSNSTIFSQCFLLYHNVNSIIFSQCFLLYHNANSIIFSHCFLLYQGQNSSSVPHIICHLRMLSIRARPRFCRL